MQLTAQQQQILDEMKTFMSSDTSVFILRGYAGTGKTTLIRQISDFIEHTSGCKVVLMAPTGRAARVLTNKTGHKASTIHKAIYGSLQLDLKNVKEIADLEPKLMFPIRTNNEKTVAIVDEASMLCAQKNEQELFQFGTDNLMEDLLTFIRPTNGGKVIFVGDPAQLPPVGEPVSQALNPSFFIAKGLKVMMAELTETVRQKEDSAILKNAMQIRKLLENPIRNRLVFEERTGDVECVDAGDFLDKYLETRKQSEKNDCVLICHSNQTASRYNKEIRQTLYEEEQPALRAGDVLLIVQNNYILDRMNGEFVPVLSVGAKSVQSVPVYVQEGGQKIKKTIVLEFIEVRVTDGNGNPTDCLLLLNLLNNEAPTISIDEHRALYINFCIRNPRLKRESEAFAQAIQEDRYFNCLKAKYGYAVTGHKCQGGEWGKAFVDFSGRTGLSDDCLRWTYTATTRARKTLYFTNLPHITPFSKFRIEPIQQCSKMNEECRILADTGQSPFHTPDAPVYLRAKCLCIMKNLEWSPYKIKSITSKPYQEIYYIQTPDSIERFDIRYKKGGIFLKPTAMTPSTHSVMIGMMLENEQGMPVLFDYKPSGHIQSKLLEMIQSACDGLGIQLTNVAEHSEDYSVVYYFRTSNSLSYIKFYIDQKGFVTYAKPMSMAGKEDHELAELIKEIQNHLE